MKLPIEKSKGPWKKGKKLPGQNFKVGQEVYDNGRHLIIDEITEDGDVWGSDQDGEDFLINKSKGPWKKGKKTVYPKSMIQNITYNNPEETGHLANIVVGRIIENGVPKDITYYEDDADGGNSWGVELYQGSNYINSGGRSYSRNFREGQGLPEKYKEIVNELKDHFRKKYGTLLTLKIQWPQEMTDKMLSGNIDSDEDEDVYDPNFKMWRKQGG